MSIYLTDKCIFIEQRNANFTFTDANNSQLTNIIEGVDLFEAAEKFNLKVCFKLHQNDIEIEKNQSPDNNSIVVNNNGSLSTLFHEIDKLLPTLRQIEDVSFQLITGKILHRNDVLLMEGLYEIKDLVRDGHLSAEKYDQYISQWQNKFPNILKAFLVRDEISRVGDLIRTELCHAEHSLRNCLIWLTKGIKVASEEKKFSENEERVTYGFSTDHAVWAIIDSIKAISTSLDALAKFIYFIKNINLHSYKRVQNVMFSNLKNYKLSTKLHSIRTISSIEKQYIKLQPVINMRHELTHNCGLFPVRQPVFVGRKTPCVNNIDLIYADIMSWDIINNSFTSAQRRVGFFNQKNNAVSFVYNSINSALVLIQEIFKSMRVDILYKAKISGIKQVTILNYMPNKKIIAEFPSIEELEKRIVM